MSTLNDNEHADQTTKAKNRQRAANYDHGKFTIGHVFSNGWVQGLGILALAAGIALIVAMNTSTGVRAAAITLAASVTILAWVTAFIVIRAVPPDAVISYFGDLKPGNFPSVAYPKEVSLNSVEVSLGDDIHIYFSSEHKNVLSRNGTPVLSVSVRDGLAKLTATILDANNQPICRIIDNEFQAFPDRAFNPKQPDEHSLIVRDTQGNEVLNLQFRNPKWIWITGRFQFPGSSGPLVIDRSELRPPGGQSVKNFSLVMGNSPAGAIDFKY
jgi:hypothetical protein